MISEKVKAVLTLSGKRQADLARHLDIAVQSMANKMFRDSWSGADLVKTAQFVGGRLAFILPDGQRIYIDCEQKEDGSGE